MSNIAFFSKPIKDATRTIAYAVYDENDGWIITCPKHTDLATKRSNSTSWITGLNGDVVYCAIGNCEIR